MDLRKFFTAADIAAYWTELAEARGPYMGEAFWTPEKKMGLDLSWIKGSKGLPVSLMPSAFDAKATFRDRPGLARTATEMPFFREGFKIKEKDRQELLRIAESGDRYAMDILSRIFDDAAELIDGANVVAERMRMALLFPEGGDMQIVFKANGVDYTYNYDPNGTWKAANYKPLSGNKLWSASATADPFKDINERKKVVRSATGTELKYLVMNSTTADALYACDVVKNRFLTTSGLALAYMTDEEARSAIERTIGMTILVNDKMYKDESGNTKQFVPDGYAALVPAGNIGKTFYGTTPEEADLGDKCAIVNTGVAITTIIDEHPVNVNTFASEIVLPSYERMDEVALLKVL